MNREIRELLEGATELQLRYVMARVEHRRHRDAFKALGMDKSTPAHWDNRAALDRAVRLILLGRLEALAADFSTMDVPNRPISATFD